MFCESVCRRGPRIAAKGVPDTHHVAVTPTSQKSTVWRPRKTTHVQRFTLERANMKLSQPDIIVVNGAWLRGGRQEAGAWVPCQTIHSRVMCVHPTDKFIGIYIPQLCRKRLLVDKNAHEYVFTCTSASLVPTARYLPDLFHFTEEMYVFSVPVLQRLLLPPLSVSNRYTTPPKAMASTFLLLQSTTFRSENGSYLIRQSISLSC